MKRSESAPKPRRLKLSRTIGRIGDKATTNFVLTPRGDWGAGVECTKLKNLSAAE
jgi:hypothetical protein